MPAPPPLIGVITLDPQGRLLDLNREAERILGRDPRSASLPSLPDAFPPSEAGRLRSYLSRCISGESCDPEVFTRELPGGDLRRVEVRPAGLKGNPGDSGTLFLLRDAVEGEWAGASAEAEERLRRQLDFTAAITRNMGEGIYTLDADGRVTFMNPAAERMLGWTEAELIGKPVHDAIHYRRGDGTPFPAEECPLLEVIRSRRMISNGEDVFTRKDGTTFPVSVTSSPLIREGEVAGAVLSFRDLTDRKRSETALSEGEQMLRALFENTSEAILIADDEGNYLNANPAAAEVAGVPIEELIGKSVLDFTPPEHLDLVKESWARFMEEGEQEGEFPLFRPDGTIRYLEYRSKARFLPGHHLSVLRDITEQRELREALRQRAEDLAEANRRHEETVALLDTLLANAPIGFAFFDGDYRFVRINDFLAEINGFPAEEHLGRTIREVLPANAVTVEPVLEQIFRTGEAVMNLEIEGETPAAPGVRRHWLTGFYPVITASGQIPWVGVVVTEITERKRIEDALRNSEEQFRTLVEQSPLSIQILSPDGRTLQVNPAWEKLWGVTVDQLAGYNMLGDRQLEEKGVMEYVRRGFAGEATEIPPVLYDRKATLPHVPVEDDPERWVRAFIYPVRDRRGTITKVVLVHEDFTDRKHLEDELRRRAEELAEEARRKDNFLAILAHELRNPLAPILSAVYILKMRASDDPALMQTRDVIERQVNHMARLINDLLELSRINRGKISLQKRAVNLASVVERAAEAVRPLIEARKHELALSLPDEPLTLSADPDRLSQILTNLLDNAARYTEPGGRIEVLGGREGGEVVVRVRDTGIGIEPELLPVIFDPFSQADRSLHRSGGGLGIGLSLVKNLVGLHGGRVEAHSAGPGRGSEFVVRLPAIPDEPPILQATASPVKTAPQIPRSILLVEDNPDGRAMMRNLLELWGHRVDVAENGLSGVERALADPPEIALVDIGLPNLDGYEVARRIRNALGDRTPFLIALTGYGQPEARRRVKEAGFDAHLVKPVDPNALSRVLQSVKGE